MKRPFAVIGITYLISQAVAAYFGTSFALFSVITLTICLFLYCFITDKRSMVVITVLITSIVAMTVLYAYSKLYVESMIPIEGKTVYIEGQIAEEPNERYGRYYYVIKTEYISDSDVPQNTKIRLSSASALDAEYSDVFKGTVTFNSIKDDNSYYSHKQLLSSGITATAYLPSDSSYTVCEGKGGIYGVAILARRTLKDTVKDLYPGEIGDILIGMMTGDDSGIDPRIVNAFRNTGIAHILAVSGLHLTLLAGAVTWFLRRFFINRKIIAVTVIAISWFFAAIAGFPMSSLRAAVMITVMLIGVILDRQHTPLNSLGIALLVICLSNPYASANAGLMMSFSATYGLIEVAPALNRYLQRKIFTEKSDVISGILRSVAGSLITAATASLFIIPASVLCFGKVSLLAPITNLLLLPLGELFLTIGMITAFLGLFGNIGSFLAYIIVPADWLLGKILVLFTECLNKIPRAVLNTGAGIGTTLAVFGCVLVGVIWAIWFRNSKYRKKALIAGVLCCSAIVTVWYCAENILKDTKSVTVYAAGDSALVLARDGDHSLLIGAGESSYEVSLSKYDMSDKGITEISALVLTDMSLSGAGCADSIIQTMEPQKVFALNEGYCRDNVEYMTERYNTPLENTENKAVICGDITVSNLTDDGGMIWCHIECGAVDVLICPRNGNISDCPFGLTYDAVVFTEEIPDGLKELDSKSYIICAKQRKGAAIKNQLLAQGIDNVYCTSIDGNVEIAIRDGRLYIGGDD